MNTHTAELSRAIDRLGVSQTIITPRLPGTAKRETFGDHGEIVRPGPPTGLGRHLYGWPASSAVLRHAHDADLIHVHLGEDLVVVPIALLATRRCNLPTVLTVHSSMRHTLKITGVRSAVLKSLGGGLEWLGTREMSEVIALTERLARRLEFDGVPADRVHVIPAGIVSTPPPVEVDPLAGVGRPRVVFLGRLHRQKQVDLLLRAVHTLPDVHLVIVGDGPHRLALERLRAHLDLTDRVYFRGWLPHPQALAVLRHADALALPSRYEEFGTSLLEGMQAGLPVVATATGGIPDVISHGITGLLVPPHDPAAMAGALKQVLTDRTLAGRLADQARRRVADYAWDRLAENTRTIYRTALDRSTMTPLSVEALRDQTGFRAERRRRSAAKPPRTPS